MRAEAADLDDRFNVIAVTIPGRAEQPLRTLYLQAENEADRYEVRCAAFLLSSPLLPRLAVQLCS